MDWQGRATYYTSIRTPTVPGVYDSTGTRFYIFRNGAISPPGSPSQYYDVANDVWTQFTAPPSNPTEGCVAAIDTTNRLIYFCSANDQNWYQYNIVSDTWTQKTNIPGQPGRGSVALFNNGLVYVVKGRAGTKFYSYNPSNDTWTTLTDVPTVDPAPGSRQQSTTLIARTTNLLDYCAGHHVIPYNVSGNSWGSDWTTLRHRLLDGASWYYDTTSDIFYLARGGARKDLAAITGYSTAPVWNDVAPYMPRTIAVEGNRMFGATLNSVKYLYQLRGDFTGELFRIPTTDFDLRSINSRAEEIQFSEFGQVLLSMKFYDLPNVQGQYVATNAGSGSNGGTATQMFVQTGTTASSSAILRSTLYGFTQQAAPLQTNFDKKQMFSFVIVRDTSDTQVVAYVQVRANTSPDTVSDIAEKGWGIRIDNYALTGQSFGTALGSVSLSTTMNNVQPYKIDIVHKPTTLGTPLVEFWVDGLLKAAQTTATNIPAGSAANDNRFIVSIANGVTGGVNAILRIGQARLFQLF